MSEKEEPDDESGLIIHISPSYPPGCDHDWPDNNNEGVKDSDTCSKCGMSFIRHIFTEMP